MPSQQNQAFEADIAIRYAPFVETALGAQVSGLRALDLLLIHKEIFNDPWFYAKMTGIRTVFLAAHPEITGSAAQLVDCKYDFMLTTARAMTKDERKSLLGRILPRINLKIG